MSFGFYFVDMDFLWSEGRFNSLSSAKDSLESLAKRYSMGSKAVGEVYYYNDVEPESTVVIRYKIFREDGQVVLKEIIQKVLTEV